ncbi:MAG: tRNA 2-thiouridine(34) synthase MnmA [Holosporales bacterium]|jgi:tRNA-specific 2-thiouridylase|nr:tRNA 2-thiouridine(34) synthase MnmA [Holosporales bacterium]
MEPRNRYAVAMSGGVDSSTAAAILLQKGYDVFGVTMDIHSYSAVAVRNARNICDHLGISHYVLDAKEQFKKAVIDTFAEYYRTGLTPNPCAFCNRDIKMSLLLEYAGTMGAEMMATGHYVSMTIKDGSVCIREASNQSKDQSYFLALVPKDKLQRITFPLGEMTDKAETRRMAEALGLPNFKQDESQDICFIPSGDYRKFLEEWNSAEPACRGGNVRHAGTGQIIGTHDGLINYTIGQRRGLGISTNEPLYVIQLDVANNEVVLGDTKQLETKKFKATEVNWLMDMPDAFEAEIKQRSACRKCGAEVKKLGETEIEVTLLDTPSSAITPGQVCAMYNNEGIVIGGGIIARW